MKKAIQISAQITSIKPLVDRSASVILHTKELSKEDFLIILEYLGSAGWFLFSEDELKEKDLPKEDSGYEEGRTPSQRLRGVIYRLWEQSGPKDDFEGFYRRTMEKIINQLKEKLI